MELRLIETNEIVELEYIVNGCDNAQDIMGNYDSLKFDKDNDEYIISQNDFDWWEEQFAEMEKLDEMIEVLEYNDIDTSDIYEVSTCDLEDLTRQQLDIAACLIEKNKLEY